MHNSTRAAARKRTTVRTLPRFPAGTGFYAPASHRRRSTIDAFLIPLEAIVIRKIFRSALVASSNARTTARYDYIPATVEPEAILGRKL